MPTLDAMRLINGFELPRVLVSAQVARLANNRSTIRTEIRRGNWQRLASGIVLTRPDEPTRSDWAEVGIALAGSGAGLSGWDALHVRGLGGRTAPNPRVLVLSPRGINRVVGCVHIRRTARPFRVVHRSPHCAQLPLVPVVAVARAVADTALDHRDLSAVRALVTSAVQRRACTLLELIGELDSGPRSRSRLLRLALHDAVGGARSAAEAAAAARLGRGGVPPFELNVPVVDEQGELIFVVDVLWRELRAALEIDSREYHFSETDWLATLDRHNELTRYGLAVSHYAPSIVTKRGADGACSPRPWARPHRRMWCGDVDKGRYRVRPGSIKVAIWSFADRGATSILDRSHDRAK